MTLWLAIWPAASFGWDRDHHGWDSYGPGPRAGAPDWLGPNGRPPPPIGRPPPPRDAYDRPYRPRYGRWWPGQVLPANAPAEIIADYQRFHLRQPSRGYVWLQCDGDFILAASGTGLIFEVVPGAPY